MVYVSFIGVNLVLVCRALWTRRETWGCRWATPITVSLALQGAALLLLTPAASATLGKALCRYTGRWGLEDCLGHVSLLLALGALMYAVLSRLGDDEVFRSKFNKAAVLPLTVAIPVLLGLFCSSAAVKSYAVDILDVPVDTALALYWLLLCVVVGHLLLYIIRALLVLRRSPQHRSLTAVYLLACYLGIASVVTQVVAAVVPTLNTPATTILVWATGGGMVACCALVARQGVSATAGRRRGQSDPTASPLAGPSAFS